VTVIKRLTFFVYGLGAYLAFLATFLYAIAFVGGFGVPTSLDSEARSPLGYAVMIDLLLLMVFAVQHSVMARRWFKEWWTQIVPWAIERSTFVLFASVALLMLFRNWQPIGIDVWTVEHPAARALLWTLFAAGWITVLVVTCLIDHFDLFGLRQVWLPLVGKPYTRVAFRTPLPYRVVRHPLYFGFLLAFWMTPHMTLAHLLFAVVTTVYIVVAIQFEERDLVAEFGPAYDEYRQRVPMLVPGRRAHAATGRTSPARLALFALVCLLTGVATSRAAERIEVPATPDAIRVPAGFVPFLKLHAVGTQGYVCLSHNGRYTWAPFGPQATLFDEENRQVLTHFLSPMPYDQRPSPTWQHSRDTSAVWALPSASSSDPAFVAPGAIPWLLLEAYVVGDGPTGGDRLTVTRFIQRVNTFEGAAPATGCSRAQDVTKRALVYYEADYVFYRERPRRQQDSD
jgi:protein-S-isoprenylcysteine O-methyltransferase Ste14